MNRSRVGLNVHERCVLPQSFSSCELQLKRVSFPRKNIGNNYCGTGSFCGDSLIFCEFNFTLSVYRVLLMKAIEFFFVDMQKEKPK